MVGQKFNRLTIMSSEGKKCKCMCDCGKIVEKVWMGELQKGTQKSCGCLIVDSPKTRFTKHGAKAGGKVKPTYRSWQMMKNRCTNTKSKDYVFYGGRGISYTESWDTYSGFLADMGEAPPGLTLERLDNNKGYSKDNCIWATRQAQARNRNYNILYTYKDEALHSWEWAEKLNITINTFRSRLRDYNKCPDIYTLDSVFTKKRRPVDAPYYP